MNRPELRNAQTTAWPKIHSILLLAILGLAACGGGGGSEVARPANPVSNPAAPADPGGQGCAILSAEDFVCPAGQICIGEVHGAMIANVVPLTHGSRPDWSFDGQKIAFHRQYSRGSAGGELFTIDSQGTSEKRLGTGVEPAWSPDGTRIAFASEQGIEVINADGSGRTLLIEHNFLDDNSIRVGSPAWSSPDGQRIAFVYHGDGDTRPSKIFVMNADGSDARRLTPSSNPSVVELDPAWSPDGGRIAFANFRDLATIDAGGGPKTVVATVADGLTKPDWSPDGSLIAFTAWKQCGTDLHVVGSNGGSSQLLFARARDAAWSPDGTRIAFASELPGFPAIAGPADVYVAESSDSFNNRYRYVMYADGTFDLGLLHEFFGYASWPGRFTRRDNRVSFNFEGETFGAPPWQATGIFHGNRLFVDYNRTMEWTDFDDGWFILSESIP